MNQEQLIDKYLHGSLSKMERVQLNNWVKKDLNNLAHFRQCIRSESYVIPLDFDSDKAFDRFYQKIQKNKYILKKRWKIFYWAASFTALLSLGMVYQNSDIIQQQEEQIVSILENNESLKQIQITLSDGSQHGINKNSTINLEDKSGRIVASKTGDILFFETSLTKFENSSTIQIDIPYGRKLRLKLSDGTLVWLNSGTRFSFPQQFSSSSINREVNVVGEAYFEVSENKQKPFIVNTPSMRVKVLGTHFNISSYMNDSRSEITLMEGKVEVYNTLLISIPLELRPNQQVIFEKTSKTFQKHTVDANSFNSWIDNSLVVDGISFHELIKKLERKYNVNITNELEELWSHTYRGEFKDESLAEVLETIALSSQFTFSIEGKHVKIFKNNQMSKQ